METYSSSRESIALLSGCYGRMRQSAAFPMSRAKSFWKTLPPGSFLLFLLGVFFLFSTFACASDLAEMGRQSALHLALSILISGLFAVSYAVAGFALRRQFLEGISAALRHAFYPHKCTPPFAPRLATTGADGRGRDRPFAPQVAL